MATIGEGIKYDSGKQRYDLLPPATLSDLVDVLTYGANKYSDNNWRNVETNRYVAALFRHFEAWRKGETVDKESGLPHLAHALSCLIFISELGKMKGDDL